MPDNGTAVVQKDAKALRARLIAADDDKIARVLAVVDKASDPRINQTLLDPLRGRLAVLKPGRLLRFTRLLFLPLDPVIVAARAWRPGEPSVPRTALAAMSGAVRAAMEDEATAIEIRIDGLKTDAIQVVTREGEQLWPRAADILDRAPVPGDWAETGLRHTAWQAIARSVATVLRRAPRLRALARDSEVGAIEPDDEIVHDILRDAANEPPEGSAMLTRLILEQSPHAASLLRRFVSLSGDPAEKSRLRRAVSIGMDRVLAGMEAPLGLAEVDQGPLGNVAVEARRILTLLRDMEGDSDFAAQRPRMKEIRVRLDMACRARFASGVDDGMVAPLVGNTGPIDGAGQTRLETCARDLQALAGVARTLGRADGYDQHLTRAAGVVERAAATGTLTPIRRVRLIEILAGVEAAEALYYQDRPLT